MTFFSRYQKRLRPSVILLKNFLFSFSGQACICATLCVLGIYFRLKPIIKTQFWSEEVVAINLVKKASYQDIFFQKGDYTNFSHPSGYYLLLKAWLQNVPEQESLVRLLSFFFYFPSVIFVFLIARECLNKHPIALFAVLEYCIHPGLTNLSIQAGPYALAMCLVLIAIWCFQQFLKKPHSNKRLVLLSIVLAAACYVDYGSVWVLLAIGVYSLFYLKRKPELMSQCVKIFFLVGLLTSLQFFVFISAYWRLGHILPGEVPQGKDFPYQYVFNQIVEILGLKTTLFGTLHLFISGGVLALIFQSLKKERLEDFFITVPLLGSVMFSFLFYHIFLTRNLFLVSIGLCFVLSHRVLKLYRETQVLPLLFIGMFCLVQVLANRSFQGLYVTERAAELAQEIQNEQAIVVFLPGVQPLIFIDYYLPKVGITNESELFLQSTDDPSMIMTSSKPYYIFFTEDCFPAIDCQMMKAKVTAVCEKLNCKSWHEL